MSVRFICASVFVCLVAIYGSAQDPTKVEPRHYKLDFENEHVQVVSVHYGPHEKSVLHDHPGGVVVALTAAHLRFTDENGKTREVYSKPGEVRWYPPFKHRVENLGDTAYDAVYVGVKGQNSTVVSSGGVAQALPPAASSSPAADAEISRIIAAYALAARK
jgi:quercetin dioxygenase-like cupin family protein